MNRRVEIELNKFSTTPHKLRKNKSVDLPDADLEVDLCRLYHHYYLDSYGVTPPNPNHTDFEYLRFLAPCTDFRLHESGLGSSVGKKRSISTDLGQAFCRYFLYEVCGITYFAHMDKVLNKKTHPAFNGMEIRRADKGDVPDYLCAKSASQPYIGEAKGRYSSVSFASLEFNRWRQQFDKLEVRDRNAILKTLKGFIIATSFATESTVKKTTKILAEDPDVRGVEPLNDNDSGVGKGCIAMHYSRLISKLGLQLISQSLEIGFTIPIDLTFNLPVWECMLPALDGRKFVGGFFARGKVDFAKLEDGSIIFNPNILELGTPSPTFYGIELDVMRRLRKVCLGDWDGLADLPLLPDTDFRSSNVAWLRDGSITGALEFFRLVGSEGI